MKLLSSSIVLVVLVGFASAQFNPLGQIFGNGSLTGGLGGFGGGNGSLSGGLGGFGGGNGSLSFGNFSLMGVFDDLGDAGREVVGNFDDVLKDLGLKASDLTEDMIENIKNVTQELVKVIMNPVNTFKVQLNQNVIRPFSKGLDKMFNPDRNFTDKKFDYEYVNYVEKGEVSPVKDQGQCGSCYAFAGVAAVEALYMRNKLGNKTFSEQQVIDCTIGMYGDAPVNNGCTSGASDATIHYFNDAEVEEAKDYPYKAKVGKCAVKPGPSKVKFNSTTVLVENEDHLAQILNSNGPVVVYIFAGMTFNYYSGGIYNDFITSKQAVDHAVLVVGIEKDWTGQEYWTIKNSWGPKWGEQGYIRFAKGWNIANMITHPVTVVNKGSIVL